MLVFQVSACQILTVRRSGCSVVVWCATSWDLERFVSLLYSERVLSLYIADFFYSKVLQLPMSIASEQYRCERHMFCKVINLWITYSSLNGIDNFDIVRKVVWQMLFLSPPAELCWIVICFCCIPFCSNFVLQVELPMYIVWKSEEISKLRNCFVAGVFIWNFLFWCVY